MKRLIRRLLRPLTRPIDGRVADINRRVGDALVSVQEVGAKLDRLTRELGAYTTTVSESNAYLGVELRRFDQALDVLQGDVEERESNRAEWERGLFERIDALGDRHYVDRLNRAAETPLEHLDGAVANLVNHATGHRGFAAEADLWFNPPVTVELGEGCARMTTVNERIVELPFAFGALARLAQPARILDVGSAESTFPLSAASLGHRVTAVDLRKLPYTHPNLETVAARFEEWDPGDERFDAIFLISTIEHFGLGAYGEPVGTHDADRLALSRAATMLADEGLLILTIPYGPAKVDALERTYDERGLTTLLAGWTVLERRIVLRGDELTWTLKLHDDAEGSGVAMILATPAR